MRVTVALVALLLAQSASGQTVMVRVDDGDSVTTGNSVIVAQAMISATLTFTASDPQSNTYTVRVENDNSLSAAILSAHNVTGGWTVVTATINSSAFGRAAACEVSGLDNTPTVTTDTDTVTGGAPSTNLECANTGLTGTGFAMCASVNGDDGLTTTPSVLTDLGADTRYPNFFYTNGSAAYSGEKFPYTASSATTNRAAVALFAEAAGSTASHGSLLGVFR